MPSTGDPLGTPFGLGLRTAIRSPLRKLRSPRYIDPSTGKYRLDANDEYMGTSPQVRARIVIMMREAVWPEKVTRTTDEEIRQIIRKGMHSMVNTELVATLDGITIQHRYQNSGRTLITISYTDLLTGQQTDTEHEI